MVALTFSLLSFIALSVAQNQTASLFIPNADLQSLVGSIVGGVRVPGPNVLRKRELTMNLSTRMPQQLLMLFSAPMADPTARQPPAQQPPA